MKFRLIVRILMLTLCGVFLLPRVRAATKVPWHFVKSEISLGKMTTDQTAIVTFVVKNETDAPIKIESADGSCPCTTLESAPDEIPAHGIGTFKFLFSAARFEGAVNHGVLVEAEDGRTIEGTFTAFVEPAPVSKGSKQE